MASLQETVDYLLSQISSAGEVYARKMFGEYGVYCDGKMIALVSDNQLFIKPTSTGSEFLQEVEEAPPYPGAKNWFWISEDKWEDSAWLTELVSITSREVPLPKKKKAPVKKSKI